MPRMRRCRGALHAVARTDELSVRAVFVTGTVASAREAAGRARISTARPSGVTCVMAHASAAVCGLVTRFGCRPDVADGDAALGLRQDGGDLLDRKALFFTAACWPDGPDYAAVSHSRWSEIPGALSRSPHRAPGVRRRPSRPPPPRSLGSSRRPSTGTLSYVASTHRVRMLAGERSVAKAAQDRARCRWRDLGLETPSRSKAFINSSTFPRRPPAVDVRPLEPRPASPQPNGAVVRGHADAAMVLSHALGRARQLGKLPVVLRTISQGCRTASRAVPNAPHSRILSRRGSVEVPPVAPGTRSHPVLRGAAMSHGSRLRARAL